MKPIIHTEAGVYVGVVHAQKHEGLLRATQHKPQGQVCYFLLSSSVGLVLSFAPIAVEHLLNPNRHALV